MSEEQAKINEEQRAALEEQRIQMEAVQKEYSKLKKTDEKFIGIDVESGEYWIYGRGWKIIPFLGRHDKKLMNGLMSGHDNLVVEHDELDPVTDATKRIENATARIAKKDEIMDVGIPLMLRELDGKPFNEKKWYGPEIPDDAWWTCVTDVFYFLQGKGSREDTLLSMMRSGTVSSTDSNTSKTQKKST